MMTKKRGHTMPRLFIHEALALGAQVALPNDHTHYVKNVMRLRDGDFIRAFNGRDGEYICELGHVSKKQTCITTIQMKRQQNALPKRGLIFAPIKQDRLHFMMEKATELGVTDFYPIITDYTQNRKPNIEKLQKITIEAAEQSERLCIPTFHDIQIFDDFLNLSASTHLNAPPLNAPELSTTPLNAPELNTPTLSAPPLNAPLLLDAPAGNLVQDFRIAACLERYDENQFSESDSLGPGQITQNTPKNDSSDDYTGEHFQKIAPLDNCGPQHFLKNEKSKLSPATPFPAAPSPAALSLVTPSPTLFNAAIIGPEGGFSPRESEKLRDQFEILSLGNLILRAETAAIKSLSLMG